MVAANPSLFDGPVVACTGVDRTTSGALALSWARVSFSSRTLRQIRGASGWAPSYLYVTVLQPTMAGALVLVRQSVSTVMPGCWQLPGGSAEPPAAGAALDVPALRRHAAVELAEELGIATPADDLTLWGVTRDKHGDVGMHFRAPARPVATVFGDHATLVTAERERGVVAEVERLALVSSSAQLGVLRRRADYLALVVARYTDQETARNPASAAGRLPHR